jgi:hypothetical protein
LHPAEPESQRSIFVRKSRAPVRFSRESLQLEDGAQATRALSRLHLQNGVCAAGIVDGRIGRSGHPSLRLAADLPRTK